MKVTNVGPLCFNFSHLQGEGQTNFFALRAQIVILPPPLGKKLKSAPAYFYLNIWFLSVGFSFGRFLFQPVSFDECFTFLSFTFRWKLKITLNQVLLSYLLIYYLLFIKNIEPIIYEDHDDAFLQKPKLLIPITYFFMCNSLVLLINHTYFLYNLYKESVYVRIFKLLFSKRIYFFDPQNSR